VNIAVNMTVNIAVNMTSYSVIHLKYLLKYINMS